MESDIVSDVIKFTFTQTNNYSVLAELWFSLCFVNNINIKL